MCPFDIERRLKLPVSGDAPVGPGTGWRAIGGEDGKIRLSELRQFIERRELDLRQPK
jgi:hypothetical protein